MPSQAGTASDAYTLKSSRWRAGCTGAETTGQAQIVSALGTPFVLEGLFGEADAGAMDPEPDSELAADAMGMKGAEGTTATADGGVVVDDDGAANNIGTLCVFHPIYPRFETEREFIGQLDHVPDITNNRRKRKRKRKRKRAHSLGTTGTSGLADLEEVTEMAAIDSYACPYDIYQHLLRGTNWPSTEV